MPSSINEPGAAGASGAVAGQHLVDHRRLGRDLELFTTSELVGAGLPLWLPKGSAVRDALATYIIDVERRAGYAHVHTPALARPELYQRSGHLAHYRDDMFAPVGSGDDQVVLRPMSCPHHALVFAARGRSWRELPLRIAELATLFRDERSGVVGGLSRVREMTLNDGHIFCAPEQLSDEIAAAVDLIEKAYGVLGVTEYRYRLSLRGEGDKYVAGDAMWERAESQLREVLDRRGATYDQAPGEAAFYGPKLDVQIRDHRGREETLSTVQVDFHLPVALGLHYAGRDGAAATPVMVHRGVVSTMERMVAHLLEIHAGAFPVWLAPVQVAVLPVAAEHDASARGVARHLLEAGLRAEVDAGERTVAARVRTAVSAKVPYVAVVGDREVRGGLVGLRLRDGRRSGPMEVPALAALVTRVAGARSARLLPDDV
jgi:threonyl-tRNA synthetase